MEVSIGRRHEVRHWVYRDYWDRIEDMATIVVLRGDASLELRMGSASIRRLGSDPQMYAAWRRLIRAQLDRYVEEAICQQLGGHQTVVDGVCVECLTVTDWDAVPYDMDGLTDEEPTQ